MNSLDPTFAETAPSPIPLVHLPSNDDLDEKQWTVVSQEVVAALRGSGFLLVQSPHLPLELQHKAIAAANLLLEDPDTVIAHPTDPKRYIMMDPPPESRKLDEGPEKVLQEYCRALELIKRHILDCISLGLQLPSKQFLSDLHSENQSMLRLLHYPSTTATTTTTTTTSGSSSNAVTDQEPTIRCKAHSDYGSITLLLTDGVPGLQALIEDQWTTVPHTEGALVVNIGSLLSEWAQNQLLATLHRVVATSDLPRTSLAFFADPNPEISAQFLKTSSSGEEGTGGVLANNTMSVAEYIQWRSGGVGADRSGVAFEIQEAERVSNATRKDDAQQ